MLRIVCWCLLVACGSAGGGSTPATSTTQRAVTAPAETDRDAQREREQREEREKKEVLAARHRVGELEQQNALATSCSEPKPWNKHERCLPSCYPTEAADPRADQKLKGPTAFEHVVCRRGEDSPLFVVDALDGKLAVRAARGRFPREARKGSWQAEVSTWFRDAQRVKLPKTDVVTVAGTWRARSHPLSQEKLRCVTVTHFTKSPRGKKLDECGAIAGAGVTCEAVGNGAARGINVVHYRLAEAKRLEAAGKQDGCQQAALEAIAVARGLPRWRQYKKLNVDEWNEKLVYKTRFDGVLDEDALFEVAAALGGDAESVYAACGGAGTPTTKVEDEQSFHTCW
ncbi:MAG TPA: hypothetical protein VIV11_35840 [Kofleriaceae bacterium]